jgi:hypothetical protein
MNSCGIIKTQPQWYTHRTKNCCRKFELQQSWRCVAQSNCKELNASYYPSACSLCLRRLCYRESNMLSSNDTTNRGYIFLRKNFTLNTNLYLYFQLEITSIVINRKRCQMHVTISWKICPCSWNFYPAQVTANEQVTSDDRTYLPAICATSVLLKTITYSESLGLWTK